MKNLADEEFDLIHPDLECQLHGPYQRELVVCPTCEPGRAKRQKQLKYEQELKANESR